jgi:N-glycosidase YbiA
MPDEIRFYRVKDPYGSFSNFAPYPITLDGVVWPTTEHYFQAQKFLDPAIQAQFLVPLSAMDAAKRGRDRNLPLRHDWETIKDAVMYRALQAKFGQHPDLAAQLLDTADAMLIEHTRNDRYWADGGDGSGQNKLGLLLMQLRDELRDKLRDELRTKARDEAALR